MGPRTTISPGDPALSGWFVALSTTRTSVWGMAIPADPIFSNVHSTGRCVANGDVSVMPHACCSQIP